MPGRSSSQLSVANVKSMLQTSADERNREHGHGWRILAHQWRFLLGDVGIVELLVVDASVEHCRRRC
jgi:hypothetical protein